jgi:hypothetical protein
MLVVVLAFTLSGLTAASAQAACPSSNGSYPFSRTGFLTNGGTYEVRWAGQNVTDGPCSKVLFNDQTSVAGNCLWVSYDWDTGGAGHYDSRNFVNCHQSFSHTNILSEALRGEPTTPYWAIVGMGQMKVCLKLGGPWGSPSGCIYPVGTSSYMPPTSPNTFADYWKWSTTGALFTSNLDPP